MAIAVCFGGEGELMKLTFAIVIVSLLTIPPLFAENTNEDIAGKIIQRATQNEHLTEDFGFYQKTITKWLNSDGSLKSQETRTFKTVWIENHPYAELQSVNNRPPGTK